MILVQKKGLFLINQNHPSSDGWFFLWCKGDRSEVMRREGIKIESFITEVMRSEVMDFVLFGK